MVIHHLQDPGPTALSQPLPMASVSQNKAFFVFRPLNGSQKQRIHSLEILFCLKGERYMTSRSKRREEGRPWERGWASSNLWTIWAWVKIKCFLHFILYLWSPRFIKSRFLLAPFPKDNDGILNRTNIGEIKNIEFSVLARATSKWNRVSRQHRVTNKVNRTG